MTKIIFYIKKTKEFNRTLIIIVTYSHLIIKESFASIVIMDFTLYVILKYPLILIKALINMSFIRKFVHLIRFLYPTYMFTIQ